MEHEAAESHEQITVVGDLKDSVVVVPATALDSFPGAIPEHEIREGVHDFGGVVGGIVVL